MTAATPWRWRGTHPTILIPGTDQIQPSMDKQTAYSQHHQILNTAFVLSLDRGQETSVFMGFQSCSTSRKKVKIPLKKLKKLKIWHHSHRTWRCIKNTFILGESPRGPAGSRLLLKSLTQLRLNLLVAAVRISSCQLHFSAIWHGTVGPPMQLCRLLHQCDEPWHSFTI